MDTLRQYKKEVDVFLAAFLSAKEKDFARVNPWGPDALEKIRAIVSEGKTIRGSLVLLIHELLHGTQKDVARKVAAAYELIQTGLIIHDDIMDRDTMRRGKPTMHVQYKSDAMALCVGDICFFLAHELLFCTPVEKISAKIFQEVGVAQMADVSHTAKSKIEIVSLYRYKTARYTFSLPMTAGARLAGADKKLIDLFEQLGESMGILFQIQDDKLDNENNSFTDRDTAAYSKAAKESLERLPIQNKQKQILRDLLEFIMNRKK
jgi:geranylgeranyl diphosphate synthase type I